MRILLRSAAILLCLAVVWVAGCKDKLATNAAGSTQPVKQSPDTGTPKDSAARVPIN